MADHEPFPDWTRVKQEQADELKYHVCCVLGAGKRVANGTTSPQLAAEYLQARKEQIAFESGIVESIMVHPWTVHVAGAPGFDERFSCEDAECDNPYCGRVQKCNRCLDVLSMGHTAAALMSETIARIATGTTVEDSLKHAFGANPYDEDGPVWYPVGMRVAKRKHSGGTEEVCPMNETGKPKLEDNEVLLDCQTTVEELMAQWRAGNV